MQAKRFQHGSIVVRPRARGPAVVIFRYVIDAHFRSERLGTTVELPTPADREQAATRIRLRINDPAAVRGEVKVTVDMLHNMFANKHVALKCSKLTASSYRSTYNTHIKPRWGDHLLQDVQTDEVGDWLESMAASEKTKSHVKGLLHLLFWFAMRSRLSSENPVSLIRQSRRRAKIPDILTVDEVRSIVGQLKEPVKTLATVTAGLGLRICESLGLQWGDVDWELLMVNVRQSWSEGVIGPTKTEGSAKPVPLTAELAEILLRHRGQVASTKDEEFIFAGPTGNPPWPDSLLVHHLRPAVQRAGVQKRVGWHTFRRTYATLLADLGTPLSVQKELMRHSDIQTTMNIYTQAVDDSKRAAAGKLSALLFK